VKTISLKKVSAVAVASLVFGALSAVVPAQAALTAAGAGAASDSALYPTQGSASSVANAAIGTVNGQVKFEYIPLTFAAVAAGATYEWVVDATNATIDSTNSEATVEAGETGTITVNTAATKAVLLQTADAATATSPIWSLAFRSSSLGSSSVTVSTVDGTTGSRTVVATASIVWTAETAFGAAPVTSAVQGTAHEDDDLITYAVSSAATAATIVTATADVAANLAPKWVASLVGPGYIEYGAANVGAYKSILASTDASPDFTVVADGRSGKSVLTITANGAVVGTRTVVFHSTTVATITVTGALTIGKASGGETGALTQYTAAATPNVALAANTAATTELRPGSTSAVALVVTAKDADGQVVNVSPSMTSSSASVIQSGTTNSFTDNGNGLYTAGYGVFHATYTSAASAKSGDSAELTFTVVNSNGTIIKSAPLKVTIGGSVATETIAFDKTSYAAGEAMTITRTAKDSAGNPVADGTAAPAITFTKTVGGTAPAAGAYVGGKTSSTSTKGVPSVFAPAVSGAFAMNATSGNAAGSALTASATVADANAGLITQIDALNAKIVALNALIAKIMKKLGVK